MAGNHFRFYFLYVYCLVEEEDGSATAGDETAMGVSYYITFYFLSPTAEHFFEVLIGNLVPTYSVTGCLQIWWL